MPVGVSNFTGVSRSTRELEKQLTQKETAEICGVSVATVRRWIAAGELRAYRFGKRYIRIDPADLRKMRREVNPATYEIVSGGDAR